MSSVGYDDLAYVNSIPIEGDDLGQIGSDILRATASAYFSAGHRCATLLQARGHDGAGLELLYLPQDRRAGVVADEGLVWTAAFSAQDALERYFGVEGKRMEP
jgi:hypothetical protein